MIVDIYVDGKKLDLFKDESISMKFIKRDSQDLTKVFAPFSKGFSIPATPKNLQILNFYGDTNLVRLSGTNVFDCQIYIHGNLSKDGVLKIENVKYSNGKTDSINVSFNSKITSLKEKIGDESISNLGTCEVSLLPSSIYEGIRNSQTSNNIVWYVPLISRNRVWTYSTTVNSDDNICYHPLLGANTLRLIRTNELRPAISLASVFSLIKSKYSLNINMPLENSTDFKNAFLLANADFQGTVRKKLILKKNYDQTDYTATNKATVNLTDSSIDILRHTNVSRIAYKLTFKDVLLLDNKGEANVNIHIMNKVNGMKITSVNVSLIADITQTVTINLDFNSFTTSSFSFFTEIESDSPLYWTSVDSELNFLGFTNYFGNYTNNISSVETGLHYADLLKLIPETKILDLLTSIIKTYNLSVYENSENNGKLDWLTPIDVKNLAKVYGYKELDYTGFVSKNDVDKKIVSEYNYYNFKHKKSKYKSNVDFFNQFGIEYGQATYPTIKPAKAKEFKVETNFSILPVVNINGAPEYIYTSYGFTADLPLFSYGTVWRFKPNTEDLTLLYKKDAVSLPVTFGCQNLNTSGVLINSPLSQYQPTSALGNGSQITSDEHLSLGFSILVDDGISFTKTLYSEFYKELIERLLNPNTLEHSYEFNLPASELVFSEGNTIQPNGIRLQNEIIIKENKYEISEIDVDLTTGKAKAKLINI